MKPRWMTTWERQGEGGEDRGWAPFLMKPVEVVIMASCPSVLWMEPPCMHRCPEQAEPILTERVPDCTAGCFPWNKTPPLYCRFAPLSLHHNHPRAVMKPTTALAGPSNSDLMTKFRFAGSHSWYAIAKLKKSESKLIITQRPLRTDPGCFFTRASQEPTEKPVAMETVPR